MTGWYQKLLTLLPWVLVGLFGARLLLGQLQLAIQASRWLGGLA